MGFSAVGAIGVGYGRLLVDWWVVSGGEGGEVVVVGGWGGIGVEGGEGGGDGGGVCVGGGCDGCLGVDCCVEGGGSGGGRRRVGERFVGVAGVEAALGWIVGAVGVDFGVAFAEDL